ncbi:NAD(P)-dependent oxidoreductase [Frigoribacterium sp. VKM Ac-2836]|uniref:NAD(P)-dependent oxidoreductase n=1 Tax=Frigoribacterium sp. VKM Ac-2836 TaxID=2739014 RepID=UPI0015664C20|nr:NAD(P)H-binding protein [Frigoribacterium sp. VKM Ac-2836]NRD26783.1 NAD(P)H-binding protein [Frigoribacterium sp. VKM Ac-2836]
MKVLVLGATGGTGSHVLRVAQSAGHEVMVLVRDASALDVTDGVRVLTGDATSAEDVRAAVVGQGAVLNAVGSRNIRHPIEVEVGRALLPAMHDAGVDRLVVCSAFGVGDSQADANTLQRVFFHTVLGKVYAAKEVADAEVRASGLDWTLVYPTRLTDEPATGSLATGERLPGGAGIHVTRADVARFMLAQLTDATWSRKTVVVTGAAD